MGRVKSKEVAEALGVSTATVSLAINGKPGVNGETRQTIMEYISRTQEQEDSQIQKVKKIIFVYSERMFSPEMQSIFKSSQLEAVARLQREGMEVVMAYAYGKEELREILEDSNSDGTKGMIVYADEFTDAEYEIMDLCKIPFVMLDCEMRQSEWNVAVFHNRMAVREGMRYLKARGCREVVYFKNSEQIYNFEMRRRAFLEFLKDDGEVRGEIFEVGKDLKSISTYVADFVAHREKLPDAIFLENYLVSIGTVGALEKLGIRIPEDISLIGIDGIPGTAILPCRLTHFEAPHGRKGLISAEMLIEKMRNPQMEEGECRLISMKFIKGDSTS